MSSDEYPSPSSPPPPPTRRRSSFAELFASRPNAETGGTARPQPSAMSAAISQQAQDQSRSRRLSITTLGLSGSPSHVQQTSPFGTLRGAKSTSNGDHSSGSAIEESDSAIDEGDAVPPLTPGKSSGSPPIGRRVSIGARAYGRARSASLASTAPAPNGNGEAAVRSASGSSPGSAKGNTPPGMKKPGESCNRRIGSIAVALT